MEHPLVTVICLCYNQKKFVKETVDSVLQQTYPNIQLIIVDDASTDGSAEVIRQIQNKNTSVEILLLDKNLGNCRAFNKALVMAKGEYIIDLAADDILLPTRVAIGVERLTSLGETYGVHFSDALLIDEKGTALHKHSEVIRLSTIPRGNIYEAVVEHFFICSPTMMIRKSVLDGLGGYDETLHYEDFDFWVRSSRKYLYDYSDDVLVKKRVVPGSLSDTQFKDKSNHWTSTLRVLEKVRELNASIAEKRAMKRRVLYEIGYHLKRFSTGPAFRYFRLLF